MAEARRIALDFEGELQPLAEQVAKALEELGYPVGNLKRWSDAKERSDRELAYYTGERNLLHYGHEVRDSALQIQAHLLELDPPLRVELQSGDLDFPTGSTWTIGADGLHLMLVSGDTAVFTRPDEAIEYLEYLSMSHTTRQIIDRSISLATGAAAPINLSTSFVLFAMIEMGQEPDAYGTPHFLAEIVTAESDQPYNERRRSYLQRKGTLEARAQTKQSSSSTAAPPEIVTGYLAAVLEHAQQIATQVSPNQASPTRQIHARHLLAALLVSQPGSEPSGAQQRLEEMGLSVAVLREGFLLFVERLGLNERGWETILLEQATALRQLFGYSADDARGEEDLIGIDRDVEALATLVAARTVVPPLSIGLFGEWGSGKTFFMRRLRRAVENLADSAQQSKEMQKDIGFYKRIVQIEFNAWHYVEGNLWASLVEHIFDNLRVAGEGDRTVSEELKEHLIKKLGYEEKRQKEASQVERQAARAVKATKNALQKAEEELDRNTRELTRLTAENVLRNFLLPETGQAINQLRQRLNLTAIEATQQGAQDLQAALNEARAVIERGGAVLTPLINSKDGRRRFFWLLLVLAGGPALGWLLSIMLENWVSQEATTLAAGLAATLTGGADWLRRQTAWLNERLKELASAQKDLDEGLAQKLAENQKKVTALEQKLQKLNADYVAAQQENLAARERLVEARQAVEESSVTTLLASYVQDRAESNVYREHLGVLALVRDDFEKLSELMEEENWRLAPEQSQGASVRWKSAKYQTLAEEQQDEAKRINRIVLYIDDLDRCPPKTVVEVLQAVHLLLAFPLFVAVVGVDARWIQRSLETRYRELLHATDQPVLSDLQEIAGKATTGDYLEKIFQIPFWLKPMDDTASERMVRGLMGEDLPPQNEPVIGQHGPPELPEPERETQSEMVEKESSSGQPDEAGEPDFASAGEIRSDRSQTAYGDLYQGSSVSRDRRGIVDLNPSRLEIDDKERQFIVDLTPLLSRSPRTLKRFINVYRLLKAGLSPYEERLFLQDELTAGDYQVVLFLLAIDTGLSTIAPRFFDMVQQESLVVLEAKRTESNGDPRVEDKGLIGLIEDINKDEALQSEPEWSQLKTWLRPANGEVDGSNWRLRCDLIHLHRWAGRVTRFSFQSSYG